MVIVRMTLESSARVMRCWWW